MFNKFNLAKQSYGRTDFHSFPNVLHFMSDMFLLFAAESMMIYMLRNAWAKSEDDEDASWSWIFGRETALTALGTFPLGREMASVFQGYGAGTAYSDFIDSAAGSGSELFEIFADQEMPDLRDTKRLMVLPAYLFKMPVGQMKITLDAVFEDDFDLREDALANFFKSFSGNLVPVPKK